MPILAWRETLWQIAFQSFLQIWTGIRSVNETTVTEELLELVPMDIIAANDIFISVIGALEIVGADWARKVSVATDGAPSMIRKKQKKTKNRCCDANCKWRT